METVFGGFDRIVSNFIQDGLYGTYVYTGNTNCQSDPCKYAYGHIKSTMLDNNNQIVPSDDATNDNNWRAFNRGLRPSGIATQIYYEIINKLQTDCANAQGKFVEAQFINHNIYNDTNICLFTNASNTWPNAQQNEYAYFTPLNNNSQIEENMCPKDYNDDVDTNAWGACLCWENGGRRSYNGQSLKCDTVIINNNCPTNNNEDDITCGDYDDWQRCNNLDQMHNRVCPQCSNSCEDFSEYDIPYGE